MRISVNSNPLKDVQNLPVHHTDPIDDCHDDEEDEQEPIEYIVRFSRTVYVSQYTSAIVEAHSEEEAEAIGQRMLDRGEVYDWEYSGNCFAPHDEEIYGIDEIEEY